MGPSLLAILLAFAEPKPITVTVCCHTVLARADVTVRIHLLADPTNLAVRLELDGPQSQASEMPVSDQTPATFWARPYQQLPAGDYRVTAILYRHDRRTYEAGRAVDAVHIGPVEDP